MGILTSFLRQGQPMPQEAPQDKSFGGFLGNLAGGVGEMLTGLAGLGGTLVKDANTLVTNPISGDFATDDIVKALPGALAEDYGRRYGGGLDNILEGLYQEPLSYLGDAVDVATLGAASYATKGGKFGKIGSYFSKVDLDEADSVIDEAINAPEDMGFDDIEPLPEYDPGPGPDPESDLEFDHLAREQDEFERIVGGQAPPPDRVLEDMAAYEGYDLARELDYARETGDEAGVQRIYDAANFQNRVNSLFPKALDQIIPPEWRDKGMMWEGRREAEKEAWRLAEKWAREDPNAGSITGALGPEGPSSTNMDELEARGAEIQRQMDDGTWQRPGPVDPDDIDPYAGIPLPERAQDGNLETALNEQGDDDFYAAAGGEHPVVGDFFARLDAQGEGIAPETASALTEFVTGLQTAVPPEILDELGSFNLTLQEWQDMAARAFAYRDAGAPAESSIVAAVQEWFGQVNDLRQRFDEPDPEELLDYQDAYNPDEVTGLGAFDPESGFIVPPGDIEELAPMPEGMELQYLADDAQSYARNPQTPVERYLGTDADSGIGQIGAVGLGDISRMYPFQGWDPNTGDVGMGPVAGSADEAQFFRQIQERRMGGGGSGTGPAVPPGPEVVPNQQPGYVPPATGQGLGQPASAAAAADMADEIDALLAEASGIGPAPPGTPMLEPVVPMEGVARGLWKTEGEMIHDFRSWPPKPRLDSGDPGMVEALESGPLYEGPSPSAAIADRPLAHITNEHLMQLQDQIYEMYRNPDLDPEQAAEIAAARETVDGEYEWRSQLFNVQRSGGLTSPTEQARYLEDEGLSGVSTGANYPRPMVEEIAQEMGSATFTPPYEANIPKAAMGGWNKTVNQTESWDSYGGYDVQDLAYEHYRYGMTPQEFQYLTDRDLVEMQTSMDYGRVGIANVELNRREGRGEEGLTKWGQDIEDQVEMMRFIEANPDAPETQDILSFLRWRAENGGWIHPQLAAMLGLTAAGGAAGYAYANQR